VLPRGVFARPRRDWITARLAGGSATQGALALQYSVVGLYNNATTGQYLALYGFAANTGQLFYTVGNPLSYATPGVSLKFDEPVPWGLVGAGGARPQPGVPIFPYLPGAGSTSILSTEPLLLIPAGYALHSATLFSSSVMTAQFLWAPWQ